jgi:hypothetical protein
MTARRCGDIAYDLVPFKLRVVDTLTPEELQKEKIPVPEEEVDIGSAYN